VFGVGIDALQVGPAALLRWLRAGRPVLTAAGFDEVRVTAERRSGATPGRTIDRTFKLRRESAP